MKAHNLHEKVESGASEVSGSGSLGELVRARSNGSGGGSGGSCGGGCRVAAVAECPREELIDEPA